MSEEAAMPHVAVDAARRAPDEPAANLPVTVTYIGGPAALIDIAGLRLPTDPTFDPAGSEYPGPGYTLRELASPVRTAARIGRVDAVLPSHDHHAGNLDHAGRALLAGVAHVLTTRAGAGRLGGGATRRGRGGTRLRRRRHRAAALRGLGALLRIAPRRGDTRGRGARAVAHRACSG
jgi:hypothetical protein